MSLERCTSLRIERSEWSDSAWPQKWQEIAPVVQCCTLGVWFLKSRTACLIFFSINITLLILLDLHLNAKVVQDASAKANGTTKRGFKISQRLCILELSTLKLSSFAHVYTHFYSVFSQENSAKFDIPETGAYLSLHNLNCETLSLKSRDSLLCGHHLSSAKTLFNVHIHRNSKIWWFSTSVNSCFPFKVPFPFLAHLRSCFMNVSLHLRKWKEEHRRCLISC